MEDVGPFTEEPEREEAQLTEDGWEPAWPSHRGLITSRSEGIAPLNGLLSSRTREVTRDQLKRNAFTTLGNYWVGRKVVWVQG